MSPVSRGFHHVRRAPAGEEDRVPPGQYVTEGFPVLSASPTPHTPPQDWTFSITQGGQTKKSWTWAEFRALPAETVTADIHCVTRWTKLDTHWRGVPVDTLLQAAGYDAPYVLAFCDGGYTTNLPVQDANGNNSGTRAIDLAGRDGHLGHPGDRFGGHHRSWTRRTGPAIVPGSTWTCG